MNEYTLGELGRAFVTAVTHEDAETRSRADSRAATWARTIRAIATGQVRPGSRTPVSGLPAWVTLEVLRGGFASGAALAEGELEPDEIALAARLGVPADRAVLFGHHLTDEGLAELVDLLEAGTYRVAVPEDAALLVMAWLVQHGRRSEALDLLDVLSPFAARLRFTPRRTSAVPPGPDHVFRSTAGEARSVLAERRPHPQVEAQREAVTVWNPFADRMLALWWSRVADGRVDLAVSEEWRVQARALLDAYDHLAATHTRCTKHRRPKENLAILVSSARDVVAGRPLTPRRAGLLLSALRAMVAADGAPGPAERAERRVAEAETVRRPGHAVLAGMAVARLATVDPTAGLEDPDAYGRPVTTSEATAVVPEGSVMPPVVGRTLARTRSASVDSLVESGVVPSAEVLAGLILSISAGVAAETYADPMLGRLMGLNYLAFRRRRSLLLVDLSKQVQLGELPWVRAVDAFRTSDVEERVAVARRVGALALDHFPGTLLPNPLVGELEHLLRGSEVGGTLTQELAADIFTGRFSPKFARAAELARRVLEGSLYARYYDLDALAEPKDFAVLCARRAGRSSRDRWDVAANGTVIEQAQILTTHNLAPLIAVGVVPTRPWLSLANAAVEHAFRLLALAHRQERPLATVKDAAYAWRQAIFFASMVAPGEAAAWARRVRSSEAALVAPPALVDGLVHVATGGRFDADGRCPGGRRFLGWTLVRPWVLGEVEIVSRCGRAT